MARKLPWLAVESNRAAKTKASNPRLPKRKPPEDDAPSDSSDGLPGYSTSHKPRQRAQIRNPSSSPPPAQPTEEFMIDGLSNDDGWVMVEDEFLTTAKLFTAHLHHADYQRLKKLSRSRGASTLSSIARPTDGRTKQSVLTQKVILSASVGKSIQKGLKNVFGSDDDGEENDPYLKDPKLAGLMSQEKDGAILGKVIHSHEKSSRTQEISRDARRFSTVDSDETDEDDLDAQSRSASQNIAKAQRSGQTNKHVSKPAVPATKESDRNGRVTAFESSLSTSMFKRPIDPEPKRSTTLPEPSHPSPKPPPSDDFGLLSRRTALPAKLAAKMNRMKASETKQDTEKKDEETKKTTSRLSDVPTFLL
jgi:hypothetical protein